MKKKFLEFSILFFLITLFKFPLPGNSMVFAGITTLDKDGLTMEQRVIFRLKSLFSDKTTRKSSESLSYGEIPGKDITLLLREAVINYETWSEESRAYLDIFLKRPDNTTNVWPWDGEKFYLPAPVLTFEPDIASYPSIGGKFKFRYVSHTNPDNGGNTHSTTLDYVKSMASAFDIVYGKTISLMGYPAPPDDSELSDNGGDSKTDIYIMNCGEYLVYGYTVSELAAKSSPSFMVMDNDYSEFTLFGTSEEEAMKVTAAHEFHHAVQFGINLYSAPWIMEATSTWMEDQVFNAIDDNLQYLNSSNGFFSNPHESLDSNFQFYNSWIWLEYMETKWGQDAVKSMWLDHLSVSGNGISAVSGLISDKGSSLRQAFSEFAKVNYTQSAFYTDSEVYEPVTITNKASGIGYNLDYSSDSSDRFDAQSVRVDHLAARYFKLTPGPSITGDGDRLTIHINGTDDRQIDVIPVVMDADMSFNEPEFRLDAVNNGTLVIDHFKASAIHELVLVLVNYSTDEEGSDFIIKGELGPDSSGGGCFIGIIK